MFTFANLFLEREKEEKHVNFPLWKGIYLGYGSWKRGGRKRSHPYVKKKRRRRTKERGSSREEAPEEEDSCKIVELGDKKEKEELPLRKKISEEE